MWIGFQSMFRALSMRFSKGIQLLAAMATILTTALTVVFWPSGDGKAQTNVRENNGQIINDNHGTVILEQKEDMSKFVQSSARQNLRKLHYACLDDPVGGGLIEPYDPTENTVILRNIQPEKSTWWFLDPMMAGSGPLLDLIKEHTSNNDYRFVEEMGILAGKSVRGSLNTKDIMDIDEQIEGLKLSSGLKSLFGNSGYEEKTIAMLIGDTDKRISILKRKKEQNQYELEDLMKNRDKLAKGMPMLCNIIGETHENVN